jgi:hypothetical protein
MSSEAVTKTVSHSRLVSSTRPFVYWFDRA